MLAVKLVSSILLLTSASALAGSRGYYNVIRELVTVDGYFCEGSDEALVWRPSDLDRKFPVISYAHGLGGGGKDSVIEYAGDKLEGIASAGYVVIAHLSAESFYCHSTVD